MYKELDNFLNPLTEDTSVDYWYDCGCVIACEILSEFTPSDWVELSNQVLSKSIEWQRKLAYCLDNECDINELNILLLLINTNDEELFEICVDTLRSFKNQETKQIVLDNPKILQRVNDLLTNASIPVKKMLQDFLSKVH
jgi:hypothetical protein